MKVMKVRELIALLQLCNPEAEVGTTDSFAGVTAAPVIGVQETVDRLFVAVDADAKFGALGWTEENDGYLDFSQVGERVVPVFDEDSEVDPSSS